VAVAAPNVALGDLLRDDPDAESVLHHLHLAGPLDRIRAVVEVEDTHVCGTAVDAGMLSQMVGDEGLRCAPLRIRTCPDDADVVLPVLPVVLA